MSRRFLNRSIKSYTLDECSICKYLLFLTGRQLFHDPDLLPRISSGHLFANDLPLELEIGCGTGDYLCSVAAREPGINFVGVDLHPKSLYKAIHTASSLSLDNVKFVRANFNLIYPLLVPGSLEAIYLHFPDPNVESKFRKRRIFSERFLNEMYVALAPDGLISVMTDHKGLFMDMLSVSERDKRWEKTHDERYLTGFEVGTKSRYQRIWESHGLPTLRYELCKLVAVRDEVTICTEENRQQVSVVGLDNAQLARTRPISAIKISAINSRRTLS